MANPNEGTSTNEVAVGPNRSQATQNQPAQNGQNQPQQQQQQQQQGGMLGNIARMLFFYFMVQTVLRGLGGNNETTTAVVKDGKTINVPSVHSNLFPQFAPIELRVYL
eukprot:Colp12_sorted_trinity150504_noHs@20496